jgi:hypothetical protein
MLKHLARGEEVQYGSFRVKTVDDKIIVRGVLQDGREMELHYRLRQGKESGFSKEQLKNILAFREKPLFSINMRSQRAGHEHGPEGRRQEGHAWRSGPSSTAGKS